MGESFLYWYPRKIHLMLDGNTRPNWNPPMQSPDFKLYKNTTNEVEFIIRDTDRKPINLSDCRAIMTMVDYRLGKTILETDLQIVDATKGLVRLSIAPSLIANISSDSYSFFVTFVKNSVERMIFTDHRNTARGFLEILPGKYPEINPTLTIDPSKFLQTSNIDTRWFQSSYYQGNLQTSQGFEMMTLVVKGENFDGWFWVEGSLEMEPTDADFFTIPLNSEDKTLLNYWSGTNAYSLEHKVFWIRFNYQKQPFNVGNLTKILFRN